MVDPDVNHFTPRQPRRGRPCLSTTSRPTSISLRWQVNPSRIDDALKGGSTNDFAYQEMLHRVRGESDDTVRIRHLRRHLHLVAYAHSMGQSQLVAWILYQIICYSVAAVCPPGVMLLWPESP